MALVARDALRTLTRQFCDQEGGTFCTDTEINTYLGLAYQSYHDLLTTLFEDYSSTITTITAALDANNCYVLALPSDFDKLRDVEFSYVGVWAPLRRVNQREKSKYNGAFFTGGDLERAYFVYGANIRLLPEISASGSYRVWYAQRCAGFPDDTTATVDDQQGWYEYIPLAAAIKCARKENSETAELERALMLKIEEIKRGASERDAAGPAHVADVWCDDDWGSGSGIRFP